MIELLVAAAIAAATPAAISTDDQQLVALTVVAVGGCRKLEVSGFTTYRGYALGGWGCVESGGIIAAVKWDGRWIRLTAGGGAMNEQGLHSCCDVPRDVAKVLVANCPPGRSHPLVGAHVRMGAVMCTP